MSRSPDQATSELILIFSGDREMAARMRAFEEKILFNLHSNTFKFTFKGEIIISLRPTEADVELTVRGTETGIPAAELPRLFERFHRIRGAAYQAVLDRAASQASMCGQARFSAPLSILHFQFTCARRGRQCPARRRCTS